MAHRTTIYDYCHTLPFPRYTSPFSATRRATTRAFSLHAPACYRVASVRWRAGAARRRRRTSAAGAAAWRRRPAWRQRRKRRGVWDIAIEGRTAANAHSIALTQRDASAPRAYLPHHHHPTTGPPASLQITLHRDAVGQLDAVRRTAGGNCAVTFGQRAALARAFTPPARAYSRISTFHYRSRANPLRGGKNARRNGFTLPHAPRAWQKKHAPKKTSTSLATAKRPIMSAYTAFTPRGGRRSWAEWM